MSGARLDPHGVNQRDLPGPSPAVSCSGVAGLVNQTAAQRRESSAALKLEPRQATLRCPLMMDRIFAICAGRGLEAILAPLPEPARPLQITFPPSLWTRADQEQKQLSGCMFLAGRLLLLVEHIYDNAHCSTNDMADATLILGLLLSRAACALGRV